MLNIKFPAGEEFALTHAVFDYNGTLAVDGKLAKEVRSALVDLAHQLEVVIVTADTFGLVRQELDGLSGITLQIIQQGGEDAQKTALVQGLGSEHVVCIGNGANDAGMFRQAKLAIGVVGGEGACLKSLQQADIVVTHPLAAIGLLLNPKRIVATLRM